MTSARKPSGFLKNNYDKVLVLAALVAVVGSAAYLIIQIARYSKMIQLGELESLHPATMSPLDVAPLDGLSDAIAGPFQVPEERRHLFVGGLRVSSIPDGFPIPYDATACPFTGTVQPKAVDAEDRDADGDGLSDMWEMKYGLNPYDTRDAQIDTDRDGFSNLEEKQAGTDPTLASEFPPPSAKLRLVRVQVNPFKLRFLGTSKLPDGSVVYQLNLRSLERTYFSTMNEEVEGFTVISYDETAPDGPTLILQKAEKSIRLVQGRIQDDQALTAIMVFLVDGRPYRANIGEQLSLLDQFYKVVDIKENRVVIRDEKSGREVEVVPVTDEERKSLMAGGKGGDSP